MKYVNANLILPDRLVNELQDYIQGGYIYIPAKEGQKKQWGELSGYQKELEERNSKIREEYNKGISIDKLSEKYYLSIYAIRKIIYKK